MISMICNLQLLGPYARRGILLGLRGAQHKILRWHPQRQDLHPLNLHPDEVKPTVFITHGYGSNIGWHFPKICINFSTRGMPSLQSTFSAMAAPMVFTATSMTWTRSLPPPSPSQWRLRREMIFLQPDSEEVETWLVGGSWTKNEFRWW